MKYCTKCGAEVPNDDKFCGKCGKSLTADENLHTIDEVQQINTKTTGPLFLVPPPPSTSSTATKAPTRSDSCVSYTAPLKKAKRSTCSIVGIIVGFFLYVLAVANIFGVGTGFIGAIVLSLSFFNPKQTNYCPSCNTSKKFKTRTCKRCGKTFNYGVVRVSLATLVACFLFFLNIAVLASYTNYAH